MVAQRHLNSSGHVSGCGGVWLARAQFETSGIVDEPRQISMRAGWCAKKEKLHLQTSAGRLWIYIILQYFPPLFSRLTLSVCRTKKKKTLDSFIWHRFLWQRFLDSNLTVDFTQVACTWVTISIFDALYSSHITSSCFSLFFFSYFFFYVPCFISTLLSFPSFFHFSLIVFCILFLIVAFFPSIFHLVSVPTFSPYRCLSLLPLTLLLSSIIHC